MGIRKGSYGIMLKALLAGWVTMVFGTGFLIFAFAPIEQAKYSPNFIVNSLRTIWEIGDAMGPVVKILYILIFGLLVFAFRKIIEKGRTLSYILAIVFAMMSATLVLAFLPFGFSRGYGIGLTGSRFDSIMTPIYLLGAFLSAIAFSVVFNNLSEKQQAE